MLVSHFEDVTEIEGLEHQRFDCSLTSPDSAPASCMHLALGCSTMVPALWQLLRSGPALIALWCAADLQRCGEPGPCTEMLPVKRICFSIWFELLLQFSMSMHLSTNNNLWIFGCH